MVLPQVHVCIFLHEKSAQQNICPQINHESVLKIMTISMPETCENWFDLVNSCVYYAHQTFEIYQVLPCSVDFKAPGSFGIHWVRQYLVNVVLIRIKGM